jgi:hypothetical protein
MVHSFRLIGRARRAAFTACIGVTALAFSHAASALVLDTFDAVAAPPAPTRRVVHGAPGTATATTTVYESGLAGVPGGARDTTLNMYGNPLSGIAALSVGGGRISTAQGTGVTAETIVAYGAFTRVGGAPTIGGPRFGLNLSAYKNIVIDFSGAEDGLNVNVVYYTSAPLDPSDPLYYTTTGVNIAPAASGAPVTVRLPVNHNPFFNWKQVDGVILLINRSGPTPATSYTLDKLSFAP